MSLRKWGLVLLTAVLVGGLGFALGYSFFLGSAPTSLQEPVIPAVIAVEQRETVDARGAELAVVSPREVDVFAPRSGTVTDVSVTPGGMLRSGEPVLQIDGESVVALATATPIWRDVGLGDSGPDVLSLHQALADLGHQVSSMEAVDAATLQAYGELIGSTTVPGSVQRSRIIWIPAPQVQVTDVSIQVGQRLAEDARVLGITAGGAQLTVDLPTEAIDGPRVILVEDQSYPVNADGTFPDAAAAEEIPQSRSYQMMQQQYPDSDELMLPVSWQLRSPVMVYAVPPGSIVAHGEDRCVSVDGKPVPVELVTSELGMALIFSDHELTQVDIRPDPELSCT